MKTKLLYILSSSESDTYLESALISIYSARFRMPDANITLLIDNITDNNFIGNRKELLSLIKEKLEFYKFRPQKYILILQDNYWNASITSTDFFILKLKVNAENKKIEECSTDHILNFQKRL